MNHTAYAEAIDSILMICYDYSSENDGVWQATLRQVREIIDKELGAPEIKIDWLEVCKDVIRDRGLDNIEIAEKLKRNEVDYIEICEA